MKAVTTSVTQSEEQKSKPGKALKKSGKRIGYNYIILKSLKESQKNDVVKCLYIKSLTDFGICVIKEGTYGDSKDKQGRDIKDRLIWQQQLHKNLQHKVRLPRLLGSFEENGNYYLVLERIKGKSLYKAIQEKRGELRRALITGNKTGMLFLDYMIQLINLLETLHRHRVVHRDVTAANFMITPSGQVAVIDMELSYSLQTHFPSPPFQLGTYGYMSPEQEATQMPAVEQDIFSVGAIFLQIWTSMSPSKLTNGSVAAMEKRVRFFVPDVAFADIIIQCLQPDAEKRPTLEVVRNVLVCYRDDLKKCQERLINKQDPFTRDQVMETLQEAIGTLSSPLLTDPENGWFAENKNVPPGKDKKKINKAWYASFSRGATGIMYMLCKAKRAGLDVQQTIPVIKQGLDLVEKKYILKLDPASPSLHFGAAGVAATLASVAKDNLLELQPIHFYWMQKLLETENTVQNFIHGVSGHGIAYMACASFLHPECVRERVNGFAKLLIDSQQRDGSWTRSVKDRKLRVTRGFAVGMAGNIYFLLRCAEEFRHVAALESAERGLAWLTKKAVRKKEAVSWKSSKDKELASWWSDGPAGIALCYLKAWSLLGEKQYRNIAIGALLNHHPQVLENNLSQYNGLSGLGEIYLEAYRILKDDEWLKRAEWIMQLLMHVRKQHPVYGPYWLVGHERQPVAEFMAGNSGIMHFLIRYCNPDKVTFPML